MDRRGVFGVAAIRRDARVGGLTASRPVLKVRETPNCPAVVGSGSGTVLAVCRHASVGPGGRVADGSKSYIQGVPAAPQGLIFATM
jgi:hypothetical protein